VPHLLGAKLLRALDGSQWPHCRQSRWAVADAGMIQHVMCKLNNRFSMAAKQKPTKRAAPHHRYASL
jgi:hypothetical protein